MTRKRSAPPVRPPVPSARSRPSQRWVLSRRGLFVLASLATLAATATGFAVAFRRSHLPNIVLITIDTLRADHLGSYGYQRAQTPALDALAREGTRFTEVIAPAPLTLPSHTSMLTGLIPPHHGVRNNPDFVVPASVPTIAERFQASGYETAAFVSGFPLQRRFGLAKGFDVYDDRFPRGDGSSVAPYTERRGDDTLAAVRGWFNRRTKPGPFFLWVHFFDPHRPYDPPEPYRSRFRDAPYDGEIAFVDAQIAELRKIIAAPAVGPTIVLATADHGEGLNEHGEATHGLFIYDSTIRVPLIVVGPGIAAGRVVRVPARLVDIAPTLLDVAKLPALSRADGRSLTPVLFGHFTGRIPGHAESLRPEPAYVESLFGRLCCGWAPLYGWRDGNWMFIDAPEPELYDVTSDHRQEHNLAVAQESVTAPVALAPLVARFEHAVRAAAQSTTSMPDGRTAAAARTESADRLAALGYFSGAPGVPPSLTDPKRMATAAERMENAIARERVDPATASRELRAIVDTDPSNALARRHLAIALSALHDYRSAIAEIAVLQRMGDTSVETTVLLGECQRLAGEVAFAVRTLEDASARNAGNPDVLDALGRALVASGDRSRAIATFDRVLAMQRDDAEALEGLADLALERGDLDNARVRLEALRTRDPDDWRIAIKLGTVLARSGNIQRAIELFRSVAEQSPRNIDAQVNLAAALAKAGDPAQATIYFERAIAAGAQTPIVLNGLAMARLQAGDSRAAADALRRSLALQPGQPDIRELLNRVEHR